MLLPKLMIGLSFLGTLSLRASLGGGEESLTQQSQKMNIRAKKIQLRDYTLHEFTQKKLQLHEFMSPQGKIFAVAWRGATHPDMAQVMGARFADYQAALKKARETHHGHGPLKIEVDNFYLELGGHMRAIYGRAWLKNQMPQGVAENEIR